MLSYTMDVEERSRWLIATPSATEMTQPFYCSEVGDFYARKQFITTRSSKNSHILFYTLGGAGFVRQGDQDIRLAKGQALLMDCRSPQSYGTAPERSHWYHLWAHIDGSSVKRIGERMGLPHLTPIGIPLSRLQPHFNVLFDHLESETIESRAKLGLAVHAIMTELLIAYVQPTSTSDEDPVTLASAYIDEHYAESISVEDLAAVAAISPSHLIRLFKKQLDTTPHDYLLRRRITRAKELLAETTLTSATIAAQVGFNSESNFSYRFSKMVGQSPRAYRQSSPELVLEGNR